MRNLKLIIEYDGSNYCGWQKQRNNKKKSIQQVLEDTLQKILNEKIKIIGSGRTDAGVHALSQVANFKTNSKISLPKLKKALNALLPEDIVIKQIKRVPLDFHSRFDAKTKLYRYVILNRPYRSAFLRKRVYFYPYPLDINLMHKEAKVLLGRHDFKAFQAVDKKERSSIRTIKKLIIKKEKDLIIIDIEADGFLYNMVRNIVGTLIEIGRGRFSKGDLKKILLLGDRKKAGFTAPAMGLYLVKVKYN
ncbi:MAG: tRNA pseudouridine(38-40) synthase TruA [Candidatus Omnitrophica bacterium]|nr:tRNA pseudouridine(38-40) synthase TruA [Candidatus Omnitrophota bacterium]